MVVVSQQNWMGWYEPDKKVPPAEKLRHAVERYAAKTGRTAQHCLCSVADAELLQGVEGITVNGRTYISKDTFYVGEAPA